MVLMDTHCHLDLEAFDPDREAVLQRSRAAGVQHIVVPGVWANRWERVWNLCEQDAALYPAFGLHPVYLGDHTAEDLEQLDQVLTGRRPPAVGEIGLDFFIPDADRPRQVALFEAQLALARRHELPVLLHVRKAHDAILQSLRKVPVPGGIAHAFNGSPEQAREYRKLGFCFGFGGMLTYDRSSRLRRLAAALPLDSIVLETDAPDLTVAAHRGERNSPEYLPDCLAALAEVRDEPMEELAERTTGNGLKVLGLES